MAALTQINNNTFTATRASIEYTIICKNDGFYEVWRKNKPLGTTSLSVFRKKEGKFVDCETGKNSSAFISNSIAAIEA